MNTKKILLFTVILMIAVSALGVVSAGLFDLGNDDSSNQDELEYVDLDNTTIISAENDFSIEKTIDAGNGLSSVSDEDVETSLVGTVSVQIDISNLTENQKESIDKAFEDCDNSSYYHSVGLHSNMGIMGTVGAYLKSCSIKGDTLYLDYGINQEVDSSEDYDSDSIKLSSVRFDFEDKDFNNTNIKYDLEAYFDDAD